MPVEIKELVIRAVVETSDTPKAGAKANAAAPPQARSDEERAELVAAAVKEVLRILKDSKER